jgi:NAD(P)-dependent dehydrogenase (short-subunit alcohol dehydrogenase family)
VRQTENLRDTVAKIARQKNRIDGLVAAAGVQQTKAAIDYTAEEVTQMMDINFTGVFMTATAVAREMLALGCHGSIVLVASMSGIIANKGLICPVYNASKAAVMQLTRNLAMEWGPKGIRVNSLCPGHVITPMVESNFKEDPKLKETWEKENMLHRLGTPEEFTGAIIFMLSDASSYMTGSAVVMDGGHTAW